MCPYCCESLSSLRRCSFQSHILAKIASCDWPEEFPDLLSNLMALLTSGSADSIHGALQMFSEFGGDEISEDHLLPIQKHLLPVLLTILSTPEVRGHHALQSRWQLNRLSAPLTPHASSRRGRLPTMPLIFVYGSRSPSGCRERSYRVRSPHLARHIQGLAER